MKPYVLAIDVGGTGIQFALFGQEKEALHTWDVKTPRDSSIRLSDFLYNSICENMKDPYKTEEIRAIGIGIPGPVVEGRVKRTVNLAFPWEDITKNLSERLSIPCYMENDANVAALGEFVYGDDNYESGALLTLGTGVGGGIVYKKKIVSGVNGVAGEIGHFVVNPAETIPCNCGSFGCLEQYASATGMMRMLSEKLAEDLTPSVLRNKNIKGAKDIVDAAREGDKISLSVLDDAAKYLAIAISHIILTMDPEVIYLSGGVSGAGSLLTDRIETYLTKYLSIAGSEHAHVRIASLGKSAGLYGARALAEQ